jgi:lipopolysaccharide/colanic/teichoic acid biosynthesis glycosyltransferase
MEQKGWRLAAKKTVDRTIAAAGLVALSPLLAVTAIGVKITMGSPVLFRQRRPGYKTKPFELLKFRTMRDARDRHGRSLPDKERMTRFGQFLRSTSLDELPQLVNVIRGELSFIGPRPLLMEYLDRYTPEEMRRHDVMPGMAGLPAIYGRNNLSWEERFRLDVEYVDNWSLLFDATIFVKTVYKAVMLREGASGELLTPELRPPTTTQ